MKSRLPISALTVTLGTAALVGFTAVQAGATGSPQNTPTVSTAGIGLAPVTGRLSGSGSAPANGPVSGPVNNASQALGFGESVQLGKIHELPGKVANPGSQQAAPADPHAASNARYAAFPVQENAPRPGMAQPGQQPGMAQPGQQPAQQQSKGLLARLFGGLSGNPAQQGPSTLPAQQQPSQQQAQPGSQQPGQTQPGQQDDDSPNQNHDSNTNN
jgi:hypothetical protein